MAGAEVPIRGDAMAAESSAVEASNLIPEPTSSMLGEAVNMVCVTKGAIVIKDCRLGVVHQQGAGLILVAVGVISRLPD